MRETFTGNGTTQPDNEKLRVYEFAGMAHIDSRVAGGYYPDPCKYPISRYPMGAEMAIALDKLFAWVDKALRLRMPTGFTLISILTTNRSSTAIKALCWRWMSFGNVKGGIRNPWVDVPVKSFHVPKRRRRAADPEPQSLHCRAPVNGQDPDAQLCGLGNFETALSKDQLKKLYKNPKTTTTRSRRDTTSL